MTVTETPISGSAIISALEATYAAAQERHPELPDVVFITGTGLMGRGAKWGHFWKDAWVEARQEAEETGGSTDAAEALPLGRRPEIFIAGERLACGAEDTLETILHEAAHALAVVRDIKDVSRDGRYHNKRFLALAEELGLRYQDEAPHPTIGFSNTALREETVEDYREVLDTLQAAIVASMDTFERLGLTSGKGEGKGKGTTQGGDTTIKVPGKGDKPKSRNNLRAECGCGRVIRASKAVLEQAPINCGECGEPFLPDADAL